MAKNTIQFQDGLSLQEFLSHFGTEEGDNTKPASGLSVFSGFWAPIFFCTCSVFCDSLKKSIRSGLRLLLIKGRSQFFLSPQGEIYGFL